MSSTSSRSPSTNLTRRGFLGGIGGAPAAATVSSLLFEPYAGGGRAEAALIGPLLGNDRLNSAFQKRTDAANRMFAAGAPAHPDNGDEDLYLNRIGNFSKGLPHDPVTGEADTVAYNGLLAALTSGDPLDFENIQLGGARRMCNPQAGLAYDGEGNDPHSFVMPPAPALASAEAAGEMVELYWMALLRDVDFNDYDRNPLAARAAAELSQLSDFRGPKVGGQVTPQTLFRDPVPGALDGPYVSQFMLRPTPFGAEVIDRRMRTLRPGDDHGTSFAEWLAIQNGNVPGQQSFDPVRRYIRNARDLGQWVHIDVLFQAYFNACLILGTPPDPSADTGGGIGCPLNPGNPYVGSATQDPFGTWGPPGIKAILCEVASRALKAVWFQKWFVHRRLRPEEYGGRVHVHRAGLASYPLHSDVLDSEALDRVRSATGADFLPLTFPEGSPVHPAYGAGHATVAGACVTILKAFFDETFIVPDPVVPNPAGRQLQRWSGPALTVGGELNKLASNVATGRNQAGVHWRTDGIESLRLGEAVAIAILEDYKASTNEVGGFEFTSFDGVPVSI